MEENYRRTETTQESRFNCPKSEQTFLTLGKLVFVSNHYCCSRSFLKYQEMNFFMSCPHFEPETLPFNHYKKNFLEREYKIKLQKKVNKILNIHNHKLHNVLVLTNGEIVQEQQFFKNCVICHGVDKGTNHLFKNFLKYHKMISYLSRPFLEPEIFVIKFSLQNQFLTA